MEILGENFAFAETRKIMLDFFWKNEKNTSSFVKHSGSKKLKHLTFKFSKYEECTTEN